MSRVYRVRERSSGTVSALKLLAIPNDHVRRRMLKEGRIQSRLRHDNVVAVNEMLDIHRAGLAFYALRHTFQTIGEKSRDKDAVRAIMGHADAANDMSAVYNEEPVEDDRLEAVTAYVRDWLNNTE